MVTDIGRQVSGSIRSFERLRARAQQSQGYADHHLYGHPIPEDLKNKRDYEVLLTIEEYEAADRLLQAVVETYNKATGSFLEYLSLGAYMRKYMRPTDGVWESISEKSRIIAMWCQAAILQLEAADEVRSTIVQNHWGDVVHGDVFKNSGTVGQFGKNNANSGTIEQNVDRHDGASAEDVANLLSLLLSAMARQANGPEELASTNEVKLAKEAAEQGNIERAVGHLKAAGQWASGVAEKIGIGLAIAALKTTLGL